MKERNSIRRRLSSAASLPDNCLSRRRHLRIVELQKPNRSLAMKLSKSVAELQREHVVLELECIDRMYLNAYVPQLTSEPGNQVVLITANNGVSGTFSSVLTGTIVQGVVITLPNA